MAAREIVGATWNHTFLSALGRCLDEQERAGVLHVVRLELDGSRAVTVLEVPAGTGRRYGRVADLPRLRAQFVPDRASAVADAWCRTIYPPDAWSDEHVVDGVCWYGGEPA